MQDGTIELELAGEKYQFRLGLGELRDLQQKCTTICPLTEVITTKGFPPTILNRLRLGEWAVNDVIETLKLGLIGAGLKPHMANEVIKRHVEPDLMNHAPLAMMVLFKALDGSFSLEPEKDNEASSEKKDEAAAVPPGSTLQTSMEPGQPLAIAPNN